MAFYFAHRAVQAGNIKGYGNPGKDEGDQHGLGDRFTCQKADDQGQAGRAIHENPRNGNGHAF